MKKIKSLIGLTAAFALTVLALAVWAGTIPPVRFSAAEERAVCLVDCEETELQVQASPQKNNGILQSAHKFLSEHLNVTPVFVAVVGVVLLAAALTVKFAAYRSPHITKSVNVSLNNEMDPFLMGKLIDDKANKEDYGALIVHFAAKGYLRMDLSENADDPMLYRTKKRVGLDEPAHCQILYHELFNGRKCVRVSQLCDGFYRAADAMKKSVENEAGKTFRGKFLPIILFTVLSYVLLGEAVTLYTTQLGKPAGLVFSALPYGIAAAISGIGTGVMARLRFKLKRWKWMLIAVGCAFVGAIAGFILGYRMSSNPSWLVNLICALFAAATGFVAGLCCVPTKEYARRLSEILGFKQFIEFTERDKIEFMLKDNPELYYQILPYAQVLGVTNAWTDKFSAMNLDPPDCCVTNKAAEVFTVVALVYSSAFLGVIMLINKVLPSEKKKAAPPPVNTMNMLFGYDMTYLEEIEDESDKDDEGVS